MAQSISRIWWSVLLLSFFHLTSLQGQSLYLEALDLVNLLENNGVEVKIVGDSAATYELLKKQPGQPPESLYNFGSQQDSFLLQEETTYAITNKGLKGIDLTFRYDTMYIQRSFTAADQVFSIDLQNEATFFTVKVVGGFGVWEQTINKYLYSNAQGIIQANIFNRNRNGQPIRYNFTRSRALSEENPFLSKLFPTTYFDIPSWKDSIKLVQQIDNTVKTIERQPTAQALDLLYEADGFSATLLPSIEQITKEYAEPAITNLAAAQETVSSISASQSAAGELDFSTTLITGLADFVLDRAQEEFNYAFMENLRKRLDDIPELGILFPDSKNFLENINLPNYKSLLISAREAFVDDLNLVGIRLPELLDLPKYQHLDTVPSVINMLTVYNMVDFAYRGVAIDTIIPLAYTQLLKRRKEVKKRSNLALAEKLSGTSTLASFSESIDQHHKLLNVVYDSINLKQNKMQAAYIKAFVDISLDSNQINQVKQIYSQYSSNFNSLYRQIRTGWDTTAVITSYLQGELAYQYILAAPRVENYEKYFGTLPNPLQLTAAGLELSDIMLNGFEGQPNKARLLREWDQSVDRATKALEYLLDSFTPTDTLAELNKALQNITETQRSLRTDIQTDIQTFWEAKGATTFDIKALEYLAGTLQDPEFFFAERQLPEDATLFDKLNARRNYVGNVEQLVLTRMDSMAAELKLSEQSPLMQKMRAQPIIVTPLFNSATDSLTTVLINEAANLSGTLSTLRQDSVSSYLGAIKNTTNFARTLEFTAHLMYCFKGDPSTGKKWLTAEQFNNVMSSQLTREAYLGLMYQRLSSLNLGERLSSDGVANLATSLINTIGDINIQKDSIRVRRKRDESLGFRDYYPFLRATIGFLNDVITTPIFAPRPNRLQFTGNALPLTQQFGVLRNIPVISTQTLDLFDNLSQREYGPAMANLVQLYETIAFRTDNPCDLISEDSCSAVRRIKTNILRYGTFFAGVASAKEPGDISAAFAAAAVPKGSSRTKRVNMLDFGLNSYFGGSFGRENAVELNETGVFPLNNISLSVPIGLSLSFKTSKDAWGSWTLFAPILDLGAVTSFRIGDDNVEDLPKLSFENILSPGLMGLYNFGNSPFSVGAGWQYGPNTRTVTVNGVDTESSAYRWTVFLGIDVPIFDFYTVED
ncbi:MAG: hypothetical protein AAF798_03525 [Bacteroidota bacterium]